MKFKDKMSRVDGGDGLLELREDVKKKHSPPDLSRKIKKEINKLNTGWPVKHGCVFLVL